jgi:hypothetical protein
MPRLLYGLEVTILKNKQIKELSAYHIRMLKQFQGLLKELLISQYMLYWVPYLYVPRHI